ncbi:hypothetical protein ER50_12715 [Bacillus safensis]|nr:hypothetical protein ER50_12715 [Bacillus safensis]
MYYYQPYQYVPTQYDYRYYFPPPSQQSGFRDLSMYVGQWVTATVDGIIQNPTRIFIHNSFLDTQNRENVTFIYARTANNKCVGRSITVLGDRITVESGVSPLR